MKAELKLWHCHNSRSLRPLWTLEELGLGYDLIELKFPPRFLEKEFLQENVLGTVPYFVDGDVTMTESTGICQYLEDRYGNRELSLAVDHPEYGEFLNWLHHSDATLTFPQTIYLRYAKFERPENLNAKVAEDYKHWFLTRLKRLNMHLENRQYLCAEQFTIADIAITYALYLGRLQGFDKEYTAQVIAYLDRQIERPAFQKCLLMTKLADTFKS